jgi:hypothetical protein
VSAGKFPLDLPTAGNRRLKASVKQRRTSC